MAPRRRRGELTGTSLDNRSSGSDIVGGDAIVAGYQQQLIALGYLPEGSADGVSGPKTVAAVKAFQKDAGLTVDGKVGPNTLSALAKIVAAKSMGGGASSSFVDGSSSSVQTPIDAKLLSDMLGQATQMFPGGTSVAIPGMGPVTVPSVPGAQPPAAPPQVAPAPAPEADKIFGLPKNVAIGGGVALGLLALIGIYMMTKKDDSESKSEGSRRIVRYTDDEGQRWVMDEFENVFPAGVESASLAQRVRRLQAHPRHR